MYRPSIAVLSVLLFVGIVGEGYSATRDLIFEDEAAEVPEAAKTVDEQPEMQAVVKVNATVELERGGKNTETLPSEVFLSGDRIKLKYMANVDAYAYWLSIGSSGEEYMLFPNSKTGRDNSIKKNVEQTIPTTGNFKFDDQKGTEKLMLILSPDPIPELEAVADEVALKGGSAKLSDEASADLDEVVTDHDEKSTTRDLVFEEEEDEDTNVVTKAQTSKDIKQPFICYWELVHE